MFTKNDSRRQSKIAKRKNRLSTMYTLYAGMLVMLRESSPENFKAVASEVEKQKENLLSVEALQIKEKNVVRNILNARRNTEANQKKLEKQREYSLERLNDPKRKANREYSEGYTPSTSEGIPVGKLISIYSDQPELVTAQ